MAARAHALADEVMATKQGVGWRDYEKFAARRESRDDAVPIRSPRNTMQASSRDFSATVIYSLPGNLRVGSREFCL